MQVERIPTLSDNYTYLLIDPVANEAAVIDAPEAEPVVRRVEELGVRVTHILSTHHHWDHSGANPELSAHFGAPVYGHGDDADRIPGFTDALAEGDVVKVGRLRGKVLYIPAHTRSHIAYAFTGAVFCGDTLFAGGCGRLFEGTPEMMDRALNKVLGRLPDATRVYCGHEYTESNLRFAMTLEPGNAVLKERLERVTEIRKNKAADWHDATPEEMTVPSTIGDEKQTNPFMRAHSDELRKNVQKTHPDATDPVAILGAVRALKDAF